MESTLGVKTVNPNLEKIANILRFVGWGSLWVQLALGAASVIMILFTITGRNFSQAVAPTAGVPVPTYSQGTVPGVGTSIFWAVSGILVLLFSIYLAFRITRYAKRLRDPNPALHPKKVEVMGLLRIAVITGFVGMLIFLVGSLSGLGVLLAKSIAQPQGIAIYDPTRIIRSLDVFVAMANVNGIATHFVGTAASAGLFIWLHPEL
ncbi:MAG: DUF3611 family protein [Scytonematopsis contorta HA4267-MV1]|jgi:small-conductance mechanosensitive channel|nr:DUF3611 family protein [Scytonematopsis contorta HA4267-MV1]